MARELISALIRDGFLTDTSIHFNPNLNVLIGGRGTGKSTIIESVRYVLGLDPLGEDIIKEVEIFGQHEIAELTKSGEKLTLLLGCFVDHHLALDGRKSQLRLEVEKWRSRILDTQRGILAIDERLAASPSLEETLTRFQEAGLEEKLKEKSLLVREERVLAVVAERVEPLRILHRDFVDTVPLDTAFTSPKALQGLPNADLLAELGTILDRASAEVENLAQQLSLPDLAAHCREGRNALTEHYGPPTRCCREDNSGRP